MSERLDVDYCRISFDKTGAEQGVESQHSENLDFAEEEGRTLAASYVDNDVSAFSGVERPEYQRLLADIRADRINSVTVWHANRLHRSTEEVTAFIKDARAHKVKLYSTTKGEAYNLEKASGRKQLRDDTSAAEYESEHRGERVALARKRQARNGDWGGGVRAYGWGVDTGRVRSVCVNPKAPTMERVYEDRAVLDMSQHNPAEAAEIRRWKDELLTGVPMAQILRDLAARQVPTVAQSDGRSLRRGGKSVEHEGWNSRTLKQILTHPRTAGHSVYNGEIIKRNAFPPIIEEDERQALITLLSDPTRKTSPGNTPKWFGSLIYQCGKCNDGSVMTVRYERGTGRPVYRCRSKQHCQWDARQLDELMEKTIIARLASDDVADLISPPTASVDVAALRRELKAIEEQQVDADMRYARRKIDGERYERITAMIEQEMEEVRAKIKTATVKSPLAEFAEADTIDDVRRIWAELTLGRRREILRFLATVTLMPIGRGRSFDRKLIKVRKVQHPQQVAA